MNSAWMFSVWFFCVNPQGIGYNTGADIQVDTQKQCERYINQYMKIKAQPVCVVVEIKCKKVESNKETK